MCTHGLMSFMSNRHPQPLNRGIRTFPHQTYGVSQESPDHFQQQNTIINRNGYLYQHQNAPKFEYHSQLKSLKLGQPSDQQFPLGGLQHIGSNPFKFHRKKGRLSEFLDKNGWMNTVYLMSGDERSKRSRQSNLLDRTQKIQSLKKPKEYDSHLIYKPKTTREYHRTIEDIMSQKARIRGRRNHEAQRQVPKSQRSLLQYQKNGFQREVVKSKMAKTNQEWYQTINTAKIGRQLSLQEGRSGESKLEDELETWQRKTCRAKWCLKARESDEALNQEQVFDQFK